VYFTGPLTLLRIHLPTGTIGVKSIGQSNVTYFVVNYPNSPVSDSITTEEWQLRVHNKDRHKNHCAGIALKQGEYVEVGWVMHENLYWFLAQVQKDSPASSPNVKVSYLSKFYSNVEDPDRVFIDKSSVIKVPPTDTVVHGLWEQSDNFARVISDEEHLIPKKYEEFCEIKESLLASPITQSKTFEPTRERLVELTDSFTNARHYDKAQQTLSFLMQMEQTLTESSGYTSGVVPQVHQLGHDEIGDRKRKFSETTLPSIQTPAGTSSALSTGGPQQKRQKTFHTTSSLDSKEGFTFFGAKLL